MEVKVKGNLIYFYSSYNFREYIKSLGARWVEKEKVWVLTYDVDSTRAVNSLFGLDLPLPSDPSAYTLGVEGFVIPYLYTHQKISVELGRKSRLMADFSDPGTGKTLTQIELMLERDEWPVLIVCPKSIIYEVWEKQIAGVIQESPLPLTGDSKKVTKLLRNEEFKIAIINYEMIRLVVDELRKIKWKAIILDESTKIKNPQAKMSKSMMKLREAKYKSIMTGTPSPNNLIDIFNQIRFLDSGYFGDSWFVFRARYMEQYPWDQFNWYPRTGSTEEVKKRIKPFTIQHRKRECLDLPPLVHEKRFVEMTTSQDKAYQMMKDLLLVELEGLTIVAPFAVTRLMKLRQICSGFIYNNDNTYYVERKPSKYIDLLDILDQLGEEQAIIFTHFVSTSEDLSLKLSMDRHDCRCITGNTKEQERREFLQMFEENKFRILIGNVATLAHGLNLQFCSNIIVYEHDFSLENYEQAIQRIERIGQKNKMTIFHPLTKNTIEPNILDKLEAKINLNKQLDVNELKEII